MLFILIGTCSAFWNGLLGAAYFLSLRSTHSNHKELLRILFFIASYEFAYSLLLQRQNLMGVVAIAVICAMQFLASTVANRSDSVTEHLLKTYLPNSEGPLAVGGVLALMAFGIVFLLCFTALRDAPTWQKLLFTLPTPLTTYISISLLAMSRTTSGR